MSTTRSIRAWRLTAATVPTRWPVPRPDEGRPSAAAGGSRGLAIRCSCRMDLLCRPAELAAVAQHAMEDDRGRLVQVGVAARNRNVADAQSRALSDAQSVRTLVTTNAR